MSVFCTCRPVYVKMLAARKGGDRLVYIHEDKCISAAEKALDISLRGRIAHERVPDWKTCTERFAHGPHGGCGGQSQDCT
jgi:hypothetical protein